jgi:hypothetical protein
LFWSYQLGGIAIWTTGVASGSLGKKRARPALAVSDRSSRVAPDSASTTTLKASPSSPAAYTSHARRAPSSLAYHRSFAASPVAKVVETPLVVTLGGSASPPVSSRA